jgi:hypothetical protein
MAPAPITTKPAPKVLLASRGVVDHNGAGLHLIPGAEAAIKTVSSRRSVTKLILGHNNLGDDGCSYLFEHLCSPELNKHPITEISLNSNGIQDRGLRSVAQYLKGNIRLETLFLQDNLFSLDAETAEVLAEAVNSSHLRVLHLSTNRNLSDDSVSNFLPRLRSEHLQELHLSVANITPASSPVITHYLQSPDCHLELLKLNGNSLDLSSIRDIAATVEKYNFTISRLEISANASNGDERAKDDWKEVDLALKRALKRNSMLKSRVGKEALCLLRHSRPILLNTSSSQDDKNLASFPSESLSPSCDSNRTRAAALPVEVTLQILSYLAPSLSAAQRIQIFQYASTPSTLPSLALPSLKSAAWSVQCVPDPAGFPFVQPDHGGCAGGKCMGVGNSVSCRREGERIRWLAEMKCNFYDRKEPLF